MGHFKNSLMLMGVWISLICFVPDALANGQTCTKEEAQLAEAVASTAKSWQQLHQQFKQYANCDDGAIAEGFSESISLLLVRNWQDIRQIESLLKTDPSFRDFVIHHVDESVPEERLLSILKNAKEECPSGVEGFCKDIITSLGGRK